MSVDKSEVKVGSIKVRQQCWCRMSTSSNDEDFTKVEFLRMYSYVDSGTFSTSAILALSPHYFTRLDCLLLTACVHAGSYTIHYVAIDQNRQEYTAARWPAIGE